ncbi:MAG: MFS transporter [Dongiaceae bacterium]
MSDLALTTQERWLSLAAIIGCAFGVGIAIGALMPLIALTLESQGYSAALIGINSAMFPLAVMVAGPFVPAVIARLGTLRSIYGGLLVSAAGIMLFPLFPDYVAWCAIRFAVGLAGVLFWVTSETWLNLLAVHRSRARLMGIYGMTMAAGFVVGPLIINAVGIEGWLPYAIIVATTVASLVPVGFAHRLAPPMPERHASGLLGAIRAAPVVMMAALVAGLVDSALFVMIPVYEIREGFGRDVALLSLALFMAGNVVLQPPIGWLADHTDRHGVLWATAAVIALGAVLYPLMLGSGIWLWLMMFLWGGVSFGVYSIGLSLMGEEFQPAGLATANTAFIMIYETGSFVGPIGAGAAMDGWPTVGLPLFVLLAAAALLLFAIIRRLKG